MRVGHNWQPMLDDAIATPMTADANDYGGWRVWREFTRKGPQRRGAFRDQICDYFFASLRRRLRQRNPAA